MSYLLNIPKEKLEELKVQAAKERTTIKAIIESQIDEYLKIHKDGNPAFTLDQFADPDFIACPAFYRDAKTWENYIRKANNDEKQKLKNQIIIIDKKLGMYL